MAFGNAKTPDRSGVFTKEERKNEKDIEESFVYIVSRSCEEKKGINIKFLWSYVKQNGEPDLTGEEKTAAGSRGGPRGNYNKCLSTWLSKATNWCLASQKNAVIARSVATWQSPGFSGMYEKRTNALTNRPELLGDCHDQCAHWSRNDRSNERANTNLSNGWVNPISSLQYIARLQNPKGQVGSDE